MIQRRLGPYYSFGDCPSETSRCEEEAGRQVEDAILVYRKGKWDDFGNINETEKAFCRKTSAYTCTQPDRSFNYERKMKAWNSLMQGGEAKAPQGSGLSGRSSQKAGGHQPEQGEETPAELWSMIKVSALRVKGLLPLPWHDTQSSSSEAC